MNERTNGMNESIWNSPVDPLAPTAERIERSVRHVERGSMSRREFDLRRTPPWERDRAIERFGADEPPVGTVLRWVRVVGEAPWTYLAIRVANGDWYVTGQERGRQSWAQVAEWIGGSVCHVAVGWREIPRPEPEPAGDDAVKDWAAQFLPVSPSAPANLVGDEVEGER